MKKMLFIFLFIPSLFLLSACSEGRAEKISVTEKSTEKEVLVFKPQIKELAVSVTRSVILEPVESAKIEAETSARVLKWYVKENSFVKKGAPLLLLESDHLEISRRMRSEELKMSELQLDGAKKEYERSKRLFEKGSLSRQQFERSETDYRVLKKKRDTAAENLSLSRKNLSRSVVRAPFSGILVEKVRNIGEMAKGSNAVVAVMEKSETLRCELSLPESIYNEIDEQSLVKFKIPSLKKDVSGSIESVGKRIDELGRFTLYVSVENRDGSIPAGSNAIATVTGKKRMRIVVPATTLLEEGEGQALVFSAENGCVTSNLVERGRSFKEGIEIAGEIPRHIIYDASSVVAGEKVSMKIRGGDQ